MSTHHHDDHTSIAVDAEGAPLEAGRLTDCRQGAPATPPAGSVARRLRISGSYFSLNLPLTQRVRRNFRLDLISALLYGVFNGSAVSYMTVVARTIGVSQVGISVLASMGAVGCLLSMPASLWFTGRSSRVFLLAATFLGRAMLIPLLLISGPLPYMIAASVFLVSGSTTGPFYAEVMQHVYPHEYRGQIMSLVRVGSGLIMTLASLATAWLLGGHHISYQLLFGVGGILAVASTVTFSWITPVVPPRRPRQSLRSIVGMLRRDSLFAQYELWVFLMASGAIVAATLYPLVLVDKLHTGYGPVGILSVATSVGYLASWLAWGKAIDHRGPAFTMLVVGLCELFFTLSMVLAPSAYWLLPAMFALGIANGGFEVGPIAAVIHYARHSPGDVPVYMGLHSILIGVRGIAFPFVAILLLHTSHYALALVTAAVISLAGIVMLSRVHTKERRAMALEEVHSR